MAKERRTARGRSLGVTQLAAAPSRGAERAHLTLRVDFGPYGALGPGKIKLLELIGQHGSITAAGKHMDMSYRRAWLLVKSINDMFDKPAVAKQHGGSGGGNAALTKFGQKLIAYYREMEREAQSAVNHRLRALQKSLAATPTLRTIEAD